MGSSSAYNYIAMQEAVEDSGLDEDMVSNPRTGLISGSGGASTENVVQAVDLLREKGVRKVGPYMVPRTMSSTLRPMNTTPACDPVQTARSPMAIAYSRPIARANV